MTGTGGAAASIQAKTSLALPRAQALAAITFWGISFVATKAVLREVSPVTVILLRSALGVLLLDALLLARRAPLFPPKTLLVPLLVMGFVGVAFHQVLQAVALTMTTAMNTGWLIGLVPIWSAILAAVFQGETFRPTKTIGIVLGFCGAILLVTGGKFSGDILALPTTKGDFLILLSTVNWAVYSILGRRTLQSLGALPATAYAMKFGFLMLLPLALGAGVFQELGRLSAAGWGAIAFLGICCSGLGYLFWYGALEKIEASRVAAFLYLEPLVTLAAAVIALGEKVTPVSIVGGAIVLAGVVLVQRSR